MSSAIDYPRHVRALATKSRANLKISRVSARDTRASVKFELICTVYVNYIILCYDLQSRGGLHFLYIEPPSQVGSFTELFKQAQVIAGRSGKVVNPCGHGLLTLEIVNSQ